MFELTPFARNNHFLGSYDPFKAMEEFEKNFFGHQLPARSEEHTSELQSR